MTFPGASELARLCDAKGVRVADLASTTGWPVALCESVLSGASPIPTPIMGEAVFIAKRLSISSATVWEWVDQDRATRSGRPTKAKQTGVDR